MLTAASCGAGTIETAVTSSTETAVVVVVVRIWVKIGTSPIVHAAMPEPVAAVAVAVVNSTLAERGQRGAGYGHGGRPLRGGSSVVVSKTRPRATLARRRGPVQPHGPL
jgi:hypothetical protein